MLYMATGKSAVHMLPAGSTTQNKTVITNNSTTIEDTIYY